MILTRCLWICLVFNCCYCWCWLSSIAPTQSIRTRRSTCLSAITAPTTSSAENSNDQTSNILTGRLLEGGKVIDFSSVKANNLAEQALLDARRKLKHAHGDNNFSAPSSRFILGINDDVVKEVGHELGNFATKSEIQQCASYLRSKAPPGLMKRNDNVISSFSAEEIRRHDAILEMAYLEAGEVTSAFAKTFFMGTMLLGEVERRAIWAVYVWCRRTDEIVDAPRENNEEMLTDLSSWEMRLENLWSAGEVTDVYDLCLLDMRVSYPEAEIQPYLDMIRGMLMDVPNLGQERYMTFDDLHLYCYRVAGTVGLMSLPVFGCANGYDYAAAREPALSLGVAFQLTNILRDVGEDAVKRGRVYLPQEDLTRFKVSEEQIFNCRVDDNFRNMMKFQIERARMYYERARRGVFMLAPGSRLPVQSSLDAYGRILDKIEKNDYDCLTKRAYVDKWEKLSIIPFSWYRTTELSRLIPLPGDKVLPFLDES